MDQTSYKKKGFTLLEMLLVLVIVSAIAVMAINFTTQKMAELRRDRATMQMQQILNAGLSYYLNNGTWPASLAALQNPAAPYLPPNPPNTIATPWGGTYTAAGATVNNVNYFQVSMTVPGTTGATEALIIAGRLPMATTSGSTVTAQVNVPGMNLNNARSVNFSSVYHSGACVPVPSCPQGMEAQIMAVPVAVNGVSDKPTCTTANDPATCSTVNLYPVSGFTAYATPKADAASVRGCTTGGALACINTTTTPNPSGLPPMITPVPLSGEYWRVCLSVTTAKGLIAPDQSAWGQLTGTILAITRCVPGTVSAPSEPSGAGFNVWQS